MSFTFLFYCFFSFYYRLQDKVSLVKMIYLLGSIKNLFKSTSAKLKKTNRKLLANSKLTHHIAQIIHILDSHNLEIVNLNFIKNRFILDK